MTHNQGSSPQEQPVKECWWSCLIPGKMLTHYQRLLDLGELAVDMAEEEADEAELDAENAEQHLDNAEQGIENEEQNLEKEEMEKGRDAPQVMHARVPALRIKGLERLKRRPNPYVLGVRCST